MLVDNKQATLDGALDHLRADLPAGWRFETVRMPAASETNFQHDFDLQLWTPGGERALISVEVKRRVDPVEVGRLLPMFAHFPKPSLLVAPFLSPRTRERLRQEGINYADATGNARLEVRAPAVFISRAGADENPSPGPEQRRTLSGMKAGRIMRNLIDRAPPFRLRWLAKESQTDPGYTSRVVDLLEREELVARSHRGGVIETAAWKPLIKQLTVDYDMLESNRHGLFVEARGLAAFEKRLGASDLNHRLTGSIAAEKVNPVAPVKQAAIYVENINVAATKLRLHPVETGANVILLEPRDPLLLTSRLWLNGPLKLTGLSQICADLLTGPGRGPSEADALLSWMERNLSKWRENVEESA
jgi:hypothetical protein